MQCKREDAKQSQYWETCLNCLLLWKMFSDGWCQSAMGCCRGSGMDETSGKVQSDLDWRANISWWYSWSCQNCRGTLTSMPTVIVSITATTNINDRVWIPSWAMTALSIGFCPRQKDWLSLLERFKFLLNCCETKWKQVVCPKPRMKV